jgi:signal transduction histidine kinase
VTTHEVGFKPRARLLLLLGDQLIRDPGIAVFELVKNAFDADSPTATVTLLNIGDQAHASIVVEDSGSGMDLDTVSTVWLEPGTDFRAAQKEKGKTTPKFHRTPIGEKGVGRFAAHKLGSRVRMISRKAHRPEVFVDIDWKALEKKRYLQDVTISVVERTPLHFTGNKTGTRIEVTDLRERWTRGMVRDLSRAVNAISSPFGGPSDFKPVLDVPGHEDWLEGLLDIEDVLKYALFSATCVLEEDRLTYSYSFTPFKGMDQVKGRSVRRKVKLTTPEGDPIDLKKHHVGRVGFQLFVFDQDASVLRLGDIQDKKGLKEFLNQTGGVRVYRGGIRVYDYGERGNDWLQLGGRRVNVPTKRLSNNLIVGAVALDVRRSLNLRLGRGLIEKTNREGFVENADFEAFRGAIVCAIQNIEAERNFDKRRIRNAYRSSKLREPVLEDLTELREIVEQKKLTDELGPYLNRIENDFTAIRNTLLTSASAGLSLSVVIHEVEKGVAALVDAVKKEKATHRVTSLAKHLADLVEGYGALVRRSGVSAERVTSLISSALFNLELRLKAHRISVVRGGAKEGFSVRCSRRLIISTIMNLIDNAIWWLDNKWGEQSSKKKLFIAPVSSLRGHPAIIVADNGPGFLDPPELLVEPFISRKPDGMGLGLHIASEVMKAQGGELVFPDKRSAVVPKEFVGAVVALVFKETK